MSYRVTVEKMFNGAPFLGEKWTNIYLFDVGDVTTALSRGVAAGVAEMAVSYEPIEVTRVTAVNEVDANDRGSANPGSLAVLDPTGLGGYLPLFNTVRVVFTDSVGRPESKYLRLGATPANIGAGEWTTELTDLVQSDYVEAILGLGGYVGPTGEEPNGGSVQTAIQNRQLGWHRRSRPGFHRGWVPD